jgi:hypothetical protein
VSVSFARAFFEYFEKENLRSAHARASHRLAMVIGVDPRTGILAGVEFFHHQQVVAVALHGEHEKALPRGTAIAAKAGFHCSKSSTGCRA